MDSSQGSSKVPSASSTVGRDPCWATTIVLSGSFWSNVELAVTIFSPIVKVCFFKLIHVLIS